LAQINKQIAQLQKEAESLREKELGGVVARIKDAIEHYELTPQDLFAGQGAKGTAGKSKVGRRAKASGKKAPSAPKFRDDAGNSWTGHGKRPNWFKAALEAGKTPDDLLIK
jgi:DNA-binding protein H-NS